MRSRPARLALALTTGALLAGLLVAPTPATAAPAPAGDQTLDILVLGDSYSAGNGATDDQGAAQYYGPTGCRRSSVNWSEKYAAALRASGQAVRLVNHACSGAVTADFTSPRVLDTATNKVAQVPAGVATTAQADAYLAQADPCNTKAFPAEEFWTYHATAVLPGVSTVYDCTRNVRPQADFVTPDVDLVLFTMGGNDTGFSSIVTNCFVAGARMAAPCKSAVDNARALLPQIRERLLTGIAALRTHGLRNDAKLVQLGYPLLQTDNNFTLPGAPGAPDYDAGNQVRSLGVQGNDSVAAAVPAANAGHPGQMTFLTGVPEKFAGHEPDAKTPPGNALRWINQAFEGAETDLWYHPNRLGQIAYAELLTARGTFGAPTGPPVAARLKAKFSPHRVQVGDRVRLKIRVRLSDGSRARGKVLVRAAGRGTVAKAKIHRGDRGRTVLRFRVPRTSKLRVIYRDRVAPTVRVTHRVRAR